MTSEDPGYVQAYYISNSYHSGDGVVVVVVEDIIEERKWGKNPNQEYGKSGGRWRGALSKKGWNENRDIGY